MYIYPARRTYVKPGCTEHNRSPGLAHLHLARRRTLESVPVPYRVGSAKGPRGPLAPESNSRNTDNVPIAAETLSSPLLRQPYMQVDQHFAYVHIYNMYMHGGSEAATCTEGETRQTDKVVRHCICPKSERIFPLALHPARAHPRAPSAYIQCLYTLNTARGTEYSPRGLISSDAGPKCICFPRCALSHR